LDSDSKPCPKCGSKKTNTIIEIVVTERAGLKLKSGDKIGKKPSQEFVRKQKLSGEGKEAKETISIDRAKSRYLHHVEEQDHNGNWKTVHHEEESLAEHNEKKQSRKQ
jgi:hypothetical protein